MQRKLKSYLIAGALLLGVLLTAAPAAHASVPSNGTVTKSRSQPKDDNGVIFQDPPFIGWKVFLATAATTAIQLVDENGTAPSCGMVHSVFISSGAAATEFSVLYDSQPAAGAAMFTLTGGTGNGNITGDAQWQLAPVINRLTTGAQNIVVDAQFNNGVVVLQSAGGAGDNVTTHVYWRPCRGGSQ